MFSHPMSRLTPAAAVELDRRRLLGFVLLAALPAAAYGADLAAVALGDGGALLRWPARRHEGWQAG